MQQFVIHPNLAWRMVSVIAIILALIGCSNERPADSRSSDLNQTLVGTWSLQSRISDGNEVPVTERFMKIVLKEDGTFRALYRGTSTQKWIVAGQGGYSFRPPSLNLHWDSGQVLTLLVVASGPDRLRLHHGPTLAPLKDQEPDDVFIRDTQPKGPTRGST